MFATSELPSYDDCKTTGVVMEPRETEILDCLYEPEILEKADLHEKTVETTEMQMETPYPYSYNERRCDAGRCVSCCKKFVRFLFSTVGVCCVLVAYCIAGGFLFVCLEAENEKSNKVRSHVISDEFRRNHTKLLWEVTERLNVLHPQNWSDEAEEILKIFQKGLYVHVTRDGWDGKMPGEEPDLMWTFAGSLLYAVTVITTIGYGHITPVTTAGRLVTIFYALFGIPITLLYLANVGSFMANTFRFCYHRLCCDLCCCCFKLNQSKRKSPQGSPKRTTACRSVSLPVIKGDFSPTRKSAINSIVKKSGSVGNNLSSSLKSSSSDPEDQIARPPSSVSFSLNNNQEIEIERKSHKLKIRHSVTSTSRKYIDWKGKYRYKPVPITLTIIVMAGYIFGGAMLFSIWEGWEYIEGSYFCFITLTTIGLGDLVPGIHKETDWTRSDKLVLCSLYVFLGLALIGMSMDLMQEEVRAKFHWLAEKIGISEKKSDLEYDDADDEMVSYKDHV